MSQSKIDFGSLITDAFTSAVRSLLNIVAALVICSGISYGLYTYMGNDPISGLLHSTLSAPTIIGLLIQGEGLGWVPLVIWAVLCVVAAVVTRIVEAHDEPRPFFFFGIAGLLASIALMAYVVHFEGQDAFNLFGHLDNVPDAVATLLHIAVLQACVIVWTLVISTVFSILTLRVPLIAESLRANASLLPMLLLLPVPLRMFLPDWLNLSRVALSKELQPLCDALLLTSRQLNAWLNELRTLLDGVSVQQHFIAALVIFLALQVLAFLVSLIPHRS
ncbi:MAG: hypothetical protein IJ343_08175 [Clostridia bacterium]|nr:hypothetical protein [Clostridia bacterium]